MNSFADLSVKQLRRAIVIKERLGKLESQLAALLGVASSGTVTGKRRGRPPGSGAALRTPHVDGRKRKRSAAWRAKLAAAARARWKKAKAQGKTTL